MNNDERKGITYNGGGRVSVCGSVFMLENNQQIPYDVRCAIMNDGRTNDIHDDKHECNVF